MARYKTKKADRKKLVPKAGPTDKAVTVPEHTGTLIPSDPLQKYLHIVRNTPKLSNDEVHQLALLVHKSKDEEAALKLVTAHLNLVVGIAFKFHSQFQNMLDLIQEGNIGLMRAVEKFDPFKGVPLPAYAAYWVKAYILKYILDNWRLVRVGTTNARRKMLFNLNKVTHQLKAAGIDPGPKQLAEHFKTSEANVVDVQKSLSSSDVSMDTPVSGDSKRTYAEVIGEDKLPLDESLSDQEISELVKKHISEFAKNLKASDRDILYNRLMSDEPLTLADIGEKHGVTREAIRQAETRLIKKLKNHLQEKIPGISGFQFVGNR